MNLDDAQALFGVRFWGAAKLAKHGAGALAPGGSLTLTSGMSAFRPQKGTVMATAMAISASSGAAVRYRPLGAPSVMPPSPLPAHRVVGRAAAADGIQGHTVGGNYIPGDDDDLVFEVFH